MGFRHKLLFNYLDKKIPKAGYQILKLGDYYICSRDINFDITKKAISSTGTCGISKNLEISKIKAISEFVEREAFKNTNSNSSTGFAAYPFILNSKKARKNAQLNAYSEMLERYALYQWVLNDDIKHMVNDVPYEDNKKFYLAIQNEIQFLEYYKITPFLLNAQDMTFTILYAKTKYGWAFGSATNTCAIQAEINALKELYMHCIGLYRMVEKQISPKSNHEKQIMWISQQKDAIKTKINGTGKNSIQIPKPLFKDIKTKHNDCYIVKQCYFSEYQQTLSLDKVNKLYL